AHLTPDMRLEIRMLNGMPALIIERPEDPRYADQRYARRTVTLFEVDDAGRIRRLHAVLATRKLTAVNFRALSYDKQHASARDTSPLPRPAAGLPPRRGELLRAEGRALGHLPR